MEAGFYHFGDGERNHPASQNTDNLQGPGQKSDKTPLNSGDLMLVFKTNW